MPRRLLAYFTPLWILIVIAGSLAPGSAKVALGTYTPYHVAAAGQLRWEHRLAHFGTFGLTCLLLLLLARTRIGRIGSCVLTILLGIAIEVAQNLIYRQGLEWWDIRDDALAALFMLIVTWPATIRGALVHD